MPTFEFLAKATAGAGGASSLSFTNIPQGYDDLRLIMLLRATTGVNDGILVVNGDSGNNYRYLQFYNNNGSTNVPTNGGLNTYALAMVNQSSYDATTFAVNDLYLPNYSKGNKKNVYGVTSQAFYTTGVPAYQKFVGSQWQNTSPITTITVSCSSTLAQYSNMTLYGIKNTV